MSLSRVYEHVAMRMVHATLGVATIPITFLTLRALDYRATTALLAFLFLTFENSIITQSRHILSPHLLHLILVDLAHTHLAPSRRRDQLQMARPLHHRHGWLQHPRAAVESAQRFEGAAAVVCVAFCCEGRLFYRCPFGVLHGHVPDSFPDLGDVHGFMSSEFRHTLSERKVDDTYAGESLIQLVALVFIHHSLLQTWPSGALPSQSDT